MRVWHIGCALDFHSSSFGLKAGSIPVARSKGVYMTIQEIVKYLKTFDELGYTSVYQAGKKLIEEQKINVSQFNIAMLELRKT